MVSMHLYDVIGSKRQAKKKSRDFLRSVEERLCQEILQTNRTTSSLPR